MRSAQAQARSRRDLLWFAAGAVLAQLALAVVIDRYWSKVRDPSFEDLVNIVRDHQAEAPGRPLVLAMGSSRTRMGLRAGLLNHLEKPEAPLTINAAQLGNGPMQQLVILQRLLAMNIRPRMVFLEIMPMGISKAEGRPLEEHLFHVARYKADEMAFMSNYSAAPLRLWYRWTWFHFWACHYYKAGLRGAMAVDTPRCEQSRYSTCDAWGWQQGEASLSAAQIESQTRESIALGHAALSQASPSEGTMHAFRDVLELCRREHIAVVLFMPPESSRMRNHAPEAARSQVHAVHELAATAGVPVIDCRTWIDDDGFYDGHHATINGADQFTARFSREVLEPYTSPRSSKSEHVSLAPRDGFN